MEGLIANIYEKLITLANLKAYHKNLTESLGLKEDAAYSAPDGKGGAGNVAEALDELYGMHEYATRDDVEGILSK